MASLKRNIIKRERLPVAIILSTVIGLGVMFSLLYVGSGDISFGFIIGPFLLSIFAVLTLFVQQAKFYVGPEGLIRELKPYFSWWSLYKEPQVEHYQWSDIVAYKDDENWRRNKGNRRYLNIKTTNGETINIDEGDNANDPDFAQLRSEFLDLVVKEDNKRNTNTPTVSKGKVRDMYDYSKAHVITPRPKIVQEGSFYKSIWGKILALTFIGLSIGLTVLVVSFWVDGSSTFDNTMSRFAKLAFIIIPGSAYLFYKSFLQQE